MVSSLSFSLAHQYEQEDDCGNNSSFRKLPNKALCDMMTTKDNDGIDSEHSASTTTTTTTTRARRHVTFSSSVRVRRTIPRSSYTINEVSSSWYSREELRLIRHEVNYTVELIRTKQFIDTELYSVRGVEYWTPILAQQRTTNKISGRDAVLNEQDYQEYMGYEASVNDVAEKIAKSYKACSYHCQLAASMMGSSDETVARQIYRQSYNPNKKKKNEGQHNDTKKTTVTTTTPTTTTRRSETTNRFQLCRI